MAVVDGILAVLVIVLVFRPRPTWSCWWRLTSSTWCRNAKSRTPRGCVDVAHGNSGLHLKSGLDGHLVVRHRTSSVIVN